jgi:hypothetical protein
MNPVFATAAVVPINVDSNSAALWMTHQSAQVAMSDARFAAGQVSAMQHQITITQTWLFFLCAALAFCIAWLSNLTSTIRQLKADKPEAQK